MKGRRPGRGMTVALKVVTGHSGDTQRVADGFDVGHARATARLWPERASRRFCFLIGKMRELSVGRGVWESRMGEDHIFYFRYDKPK